MSKLTIAHLFPDLLNLYGDGGNVRILEQRALWRGINVEVLKIASDERFDFADADIVFLGGAPDREQKMASEILQTMQEQLRWYVEKGGVLLAICGGYQMLGKTWILNNESLPGLGILDIETKRGNGENRLVGDIVLSSSISSSPIVGYENHAGLTYLGKTAKPFGKTIFGNGNNAEDKTDGVLYKNTLGTYLHGPLLAKNPEVADYLILQALKQQGCDIDYLEKLDDSIEDEARNVQLKKLGLTNAIK